MLGDVLRLSWSMSLGSLLPSSLTLRLSELSPSPSDGELGRLISWGQRREGGSWSAADTFALRGLRPSRADGAAGMGLCPRGPTLAPLVWGPLSSPAWERGHCHRPRGKSAGDFSRGTGCQLWSAGLGCKLTCVFVFLELVLSASSVSEATFSRWRLVLFRGDEASSFTFCSGKVHGEDQAKGGCPISLREDMTTGGRHLAPTF